MLCERFSPQQISARLRLDYPDDEEMRIAAETIYQSLYVQSLGLMRKDLARHPRSGRSKRKSRAAGPPAGARSRTWCRSLSARPRSKTGPCPATGRATCWSASKTALYIGTLVERQTRYVLLSYLGNDASNRDRDRQTGRADQRLPDHLRLSLTWDQGKEMARHLDFTVDTGVKVYFCDPHSPWQRGSNENTNGLLRQYFPKGTDLASAQPTRTRSRRRPTQPQTQTNARLAKPS